MAAKRRVAVLVSGRGSNMAALAEAARDPGYPAEIALVLSNRPGAGALARAAGFGIATATVDHKPFGKDREAFERQVDAVLTQHRVELLCFAGFMRILTPWFTDRWAGRMLNIHPSLLPAYPGLHTHERALADGVRIHGCTVHFVVSELDAGPTVAAAAVPVRPDDTVEALAARVLAAEHILYPMALRLVAGGEARLEGGRIVYAGFAAEGMLIVPAADPPASRF